MKRPAQWRQVLVHLRNVGPLTAGEARRLGYGDRLAARITDIKESGKLLDGEKIETTTVKRRDQRGEMADVAKYRLVPPAIDRGALFKDEDTRTRDPWAGPHPI